MPELSMVDQKDLSSLAILLIIWRRPHTLSRVIDAIRIIRPKTLFVACDGPSPDRAGEAEKVAATRNCIGNEVDWPCNIHRLYSPVNLGCRVGVSRAITWFFDHVEEGIILEDDCVPHPDFFSYCGMLLERFRHDTRIWCISGSNFQKGHWRGDGSYYFSRYPHCWGWATWRRCWALYDSSLAQWPYLRQSNILESIFPDAFERQYWTSIWQRIHDRPDLAGTWDYQWSFTCLINGALTALPNRNLVSNIGFGSDATHTFPSAYCQQDQISEPLGKMITPSFIVRHELADSYTFRTHYVGAENPFLSYFLVKTKARLKQLLLSGKDSGL